MTIHNTNAQKIIAVTMGDPSGIGPEIIARSWRDPKTHAGATPIVVGHPEVMRRAVALVGGGIEVRVVPSPAPPDFPGESSVNVMPCLAVCGDDAADAPPARIDARGGQAAYDALVAAARLALAGKIDALVTAPLNKAALHLAGHHYPGHTELLAELCGVDEFAMMLYLPPGAETRGPAGLAIAHVTLHMALRDVPRSITTEGVLATARLLHGVMHKLKGARPTIGVCALNPHAGEEGLFGDEESRIIRPAVEQGIAAGLDLAGPLPADTLIARARDGAFDGVVAMYHDQGHVAMKLLSMRRAVNVTLGLPITRTSVAHGTAFDLAWQGTCDAGGMVEAIGVAKRLAGLRNV